MLAITEDLDYLAIEEPTKATIATWTRSKLPLKLPWHPEQTIPLGTIFQSHNINDPWAKISPFDADSLLSTPTIVQREDGTESSFTSRSTSSTSATHDHLSLGLGVGVGLPFLAEVSVTGTYDKDVLENQDACKTSIRSTVRAGSVTFERQPQLSAEAIVTLKYGGGLSAFHEKYGDYYVAAYGLGGDTGLMLSGSNAAKKEIEKFGITVRVEVLFIGASTTHTKEFETATAQSSLRLLGYDTLDHQNWNTSMKDHGAAASELRNQASQIILCSQALDIRVTEKLDSLGICHGDHLDVGDCQKLTQSGLVAELILLPVSGLREVVEWVIQDDII